MKLFTPNILRLIPRHDRTPLVVIGMLIGSLTYLTTLTKVPWYIPWSLMFSLVAIICVWWKRRAKNTK